ncbi:hypothetical protein ACQR1I_19830 [Bradyrhizobium sp. HKCCYLS2038]|uniref:hypothetical protein n=1 Tax=Bradyrhizobium sp. HKCCYLS2038 TaxID=3420764 RepID=UPI003EB865C5
MKKDSQGEHWDFITGKVTIARPTWYQSTNIEGHTVWAIFGNPQQHGSLELNYTPVLYTKLARTLADLVSPAAFENTSEGCQVACDSNSPFCQTFTLEPGQASGLTTLTNRLLDKPGTLSASELREMFELESDPCGRGETSFKDGIVNNVGEEACVLRADGDAARYNAKISVPVNLQGEFKVTNGAVSFSFPSPETRAELHFLPDEGEGDKRKASLLKALDEEQGGPIKNVYANRKYVDFSVGDKSCFRVSLPQNR